jgi:hypothetical protein
MIEKYSKKQKKMRKNIKKVYKTISIQIFRIILWSSLSTVSPYHINFRLLVQPLDSKSVPFFLSRG